MDLDVFETEDGRLLVNELQALFGSTNPKDKLKVNGKAGRYIYRADEAKWVFEEGDFCRNRCANARVEYLISKLSKKV